MFIFVKLKKYDKKDEIKEMNDRGRNQGKTTEAGERKAHIAESSVKSRTSKASCMNNTVGTGNITKLFF